MKKPKIMYVVSALIIAFAIGLISLFTFWVSYPYKTLELNKEPIKVITKELRKGDTLMYLLDYCKINEGKVTINRKFVDGVVYSMPTIEAINPVGCRISTIGIEIPYNLPSGTYYLEINYTYTVNPVRDITVTTKTESFVVIE